MIARSYDKVPENDSILLDLPYREGSGMETFDHAKPHHRPIGMHDPGTGSFIWTTLGTGLMALEFVTTGGGAVAGVYLDAAAADTADLDFTTGAFSLGCWVKWTWNGYSSIVIGRYGVDLDGWEIYFDISGGRNTLSQRHHHASLTPNLNSKGG